jgi:hypothetical protein
MAHASTRHRPRLAAAPMQVAVTGGFSHILPGHEFLLSLDWFVGFALAGLAVFWCARALGMHAAVRRMRVSARAIASIIRRGLDASEFRPADLDQAAITLGSLYEGLTLLWMLDLQAVRWRGQAIASVPLPLDGLRMEARLQSVSWNAVC